MDASEAEALFAQTLLGGYDDEAPWEAVSALRQDGSRDIFEHAVAWCLSDDALKRARGANILCQLRRARSAQAQTEEPKYVKREWMFRDESYSALARMLEDEQDPLVLSSAIHAFGHLGDDRAVPLILRYQDHPGENVRFAVAFALGCFPNDAQSVCSLLRLTSDADPDVRDWAVFGLGVQGDVDSPEIRDALLRCLEDEDIDVREEAAVGLGKRKDQRLIPKLRTMLDQSELKIRVAEAAAALLGLDQPPPEWTVADYKAALISKFDLSS
jgi:HEAT repeat protein